MTRAWVQQWFSAQQCERGGVVRRRIDYVEQYASLDEVEREARQRGWHCVVIGDQVIVLCNQGDMQVVC